MTRYSQHFLVNRSLCRKIVTLAALTSTDRVVEVGPGRGALTELLLAQAAEVWTIEIDHRLVRLLRDRLGSHSTLHFIEHDALQYPYDQIPAPFKVVANLPYAVASPLLIRLLEFRQAIPLMVLMFQREVAERLLAKPGGRQYGLLSLMVQLYADVQLQTIVSPGSFRPRPKVESAIVTVTPLPRPRCVVTDESLLIRLARRAFSQRRKTLRKSLQSTTFSAEQCRALLEAATIDPKRRPETLTLDEWARLSNSCSSMQITI